MAERDVVVATGDEKRPLISLDELSNELFGLRGTPRRDRIDRYQRHLAKRHRRADRLTRWLLHFPVRWAYSSDIIDGQKVEFYHGLGHLAYVFWYDVVEDLDEMAYRLSHRGVSGYDWLARLRWAIYSTLDGVAFHYLDDAYIPTLADVRARVAGQRQMAWRQRHNQAIEQAQAAWEELKPALEQK